MAAEQHRWAKLVGIIFMPPLVAIGTLVVLSAYLVAEPLVAARTALVSALFMAIIPAAYIGWLIRRQRIHGGIELVITEERLRPYLVCTLSCAIGAVVLIRLSPRSTSGRWPSVTCSGYPDGSDHPTLEDQYARSRQRPPDYGTAQRTGAYGAAGHPHRAARLLGASTRLPAHHPPSCRRNAARQPGGLARFRHHPAAAVSGPSSAIVCADQRYFPGRTLLPHGANPGKYGILTGYR